MTSMSRDRCGAISLRVEARRSRRRAAVAGLAYLGFSTVYCVAFCRFGSLECSRSAGLVTCVQRTALLGLVPLSEHAVEGLRGARVTESCDDGCAYRVELDTGQGVVALNELWIGNRDAQADKASAINAYILGGQPNLGIDVRVSDLANVVAPWSILMALSAPLVWRWIRPTRRE